MSKTMIRADSELVEGLKLIKGKSGKSLTYCEILKSLVHHSLMEDMAYIRDGYVDVGSVVTSKEDGDVVISNIVGDKVMFSDGTYVFNGSHTCRQLCFVTGSVDAHVGRLAQ